LCDKGAVIGIYEQSTCARLEFTPDELFGMVRNE
jgi:hypothetical protein